MKETYRYIWVFPLIGGILSLIALATPAASLYESDSYFVLWMWGLLTVQFYDPIVGDYSNTAFSDNLYILIPSIILSIIIGLSAIYLISSGITCKRDMKKDTGVKTNWLTPIILIVISTITWTINIELVYQFGPSSMSFWEYILPGYGIIGSFIGAGIAGVGYLLFKNIVKIREVIIFNAPQKRILILPSTPKQSGFITKFCPECGAHVDDEVPNYCTSCGFKLK
ncbi:MAG: zinc ribbon domain-containing protein [Promethearchaeota archaeon]